MEHLINVHIEKLPEGVYPATSEDVQGLVAQGRTVRGRRSARPRSPHASRNAESASSNPAAVTNTASSACG